jgi:hypothetical protein
MTIRKIIWKYFSLIIVFLFSVVLIIINLINKSKLNGKSVYVIGVVTQKEPYRSGGVIYSFEYYFGGLKYRGENTDVFWRKHVNELFFLKLLLKNDSTIGEADFNSTTVPFCLTLDKVPKNGWKELPIDSCK